ncbi:hypothetical protein HPB50_024530 [Hyalomma asiaticum]|uniref:Uncharacterized protein n=1 Tax=Hyalomma asiaticum TaxID=266040 RepID=A0ACB7SL20_HYAAI|nr:hypothetical protein HPB50_024530 [Hyalomma asiaticum]
MPGTSECFLHAGANVQSPPDSGDQKRKARQRSSAGLDQCPSDTCSKLTPDSERRRARRAGGMNTGTRCHRMSPKTSEDLELASLAPSVPRNAAAAATAALSTLEADSGSARPRTKAALARSGANKTTPKDG